MTGNRVVDGGAGAQVAGFESQLKVQDLNARYVEAILAKHGFAPATQ